MRPILYFDFSIDKEKNCIHVKRQFAADLPLVWQAWTDPLLLDQWWAPKPYRAKTKSMEFRNGGMWLYAMISPQEEYHWCRLDYLDIEDKVSYQGQDAFCNELGEINIVHPRSTWYNQFTSHEDGTTMVKIQIKYASLSDLELVISMGFKEGFTMGMTNLDEILSEREA